MVVKRHGVDFQVKGVCRVEACGRPNQAHMYCSKHLARWQKHGDPLQVGEITGRPLKGDVPTFAAIHKRLARQRGSASLHVCVDCGGQAREWSYDNRDDQELVGRSGRFAVAYSLDLSHYEPRCSSCHRLFDNARRKEESA